MAAASENIKPLKRHPAIVAFSRDHHFALLLVWKIKQGLKQNIDTSRIGSYILFFFDKELKKHFADEETELFSQLPENDALRIRAYNEHRIIYNLVDSIKSKSTNTVLLNEFAQTLEAHIRFEERSLFPHLEVKLPEVYLQNLASAHTEHVCTVDDNWANHFWKTK